MDYLYNLKTLFETEAFYMIESSINGWGVCFRDGLSGKSLGDKLTLRKAFELAINSRTEHGLNNPILLYGIERGHYDSMPSGAFLDSGEVKTFSRGYYLTPMNDNPRAELLLECFKPENMKEPKAHYSFTDYESKGGDLNYREIFGHNFGYYISHFKNCSNYCVSFHSEGNASNYLEFRSLKTAVQSVLEDQAAKATAYPVIIQSGDDKPRHAVIDSTTIKCMTSGYFPVSHDGLTYEKAIEKFIEAETQRTI